MDNTLPDGLKIKLIVTDLDGTLLNDNGEVSEKTAQIIKKILAKRPDLHFVIATGRTRPATMTVRERLGLVGRPNTEALNSNGCVVYDSDGNVIWQSTLPYDYILEFHELLRPLPHAVYGYTYKKGMLTFDPIFAQKAAELIGEDIEVGDKEKHIEEVKAGGDRATIYKVSYFAAGPEGVKKLEDLKKLGQKYNLEYAEYNPVIVEYMPPNTNKGTGLTELIKKLNISKEEVIAFGDGGNDIQLLQNAGWPVAMENACDALKPLAKLIAKPNDEDGVADLLEKIFLADEEDKDHLN